MRLCRLALFALVLAAPAQAAGLTDILGIGTHIDNIHSDYADTAQAIADTQFTGIRIIRFNLNTNAFILPAMNRFCAAGIKLNPIFMDDPAPHWPVVHDLATRGCLASLEGPNEINATRPHYAGLVGNEAAVALQAALYRLAKGDAATAALPVFSFTLSIGGTGTGPAATVGLAPAGASADFGTTHPYMSHGGQPGCCIMRMVRASEAWAPGKPYVVTETGYRTMVGQDSAVDEPTQARLLANSIFDLYQAGVRRIMLYQLLDMVDDPAYRDREAHWGMFRHVGPAAEPREARKPSAEMLHRLTATLAGADRGANLHYTLTGAPPQTRGMALTRPGGGGFVVVWSEPWIWDEGAHAPIPIEPTNAMLHLDTAGAVTVLNLVSGASVAFHGQQDIPLPIAADALVVTIGPK